jgi:hemerythrin superfamily protein
MATAKATIDHDTIKRWVEEHGGCPAHVKRSASKNDAGILRIDFPGYSGRQSLEQLSWDEFFDAFEENELAFLYQDEEGSRFSKFVSRDSADLDGQSESASGSASRSSRAGSDTGKSAAARSSRSTSRRSKSSSPGGRSTTKRKTGSDKSRTSSAAKSSSPRSRGASSRAKTTAAESRAKSRGNARSVKASSRTRAGANGAGKRMAGAQSDAPDAISLLTEQHREVEGLFEKLESARGTAQKERVFAKLADALAAHAKIEEEIFYPSVFSKKTETELRESVEEHLVVKRLVADMLGMEASNPQFMSKASVLKEVVRHHVEEEEHQLFPEVRTQSEEDLDELGGRMQERYEQLMEREPRKQVPKEARAAAVPF